MVTRILCSLCGSGSDCRATPVGYVFVLLRCVLVSSVGIEIDNECDVLCLLRGVVALLATVREWYYFAFFRIYSAYEANKKDIPESISTVRLSTMPNQICTHKSSRRM